MFALKNYQQGPQRLLAACDEALVGNSYREGKFRLDVLESFYDGMRVEEEALRAHLGSCTVANLVGPATVRVALQMGLIAEDNILVVEGIPHAQLLVLES